MYYPAIVLKPICEGVVMPDESANDVETLADLERILAQDPTLRQAGEALEAIVALHQARAAPIPLAMALRRLGHVRLRSGQLSLAVDTWQKASHLLRGRANDPTAVSGLAEVLIDLGGLLCATQRGEAAEDPLIEATAILRAESHMSGRFAWALNLLAASRQMTGRAEAALEALREAEAVARHIAVASRSSSDAAKWALILNNMGRIEIDAGRPEAARHTLEICLEVTRELLEVERSPNNLTLHSAVSSRYAQAMERIGQPAMALPYYDEAVEIMQALIKDGRQDLTDDLADVEANRSRLLEKLGNC
jgi:tetratricopeptide (TPR) repeat protein